MPKIGYSLTELKPVEDSTVLRPYWQTTDREKVRLYKGDVLEVLRQLPSRSVQMVVTSPPYWGLRDYGTGTWAGGDPKCIHTLLRPPGVDSKQATNAPGHNSRDSVAGLTYCRKCGAHRIDQQLGSEPSPDCGTHGQSQCGRCFVCAMVAVFREVRRVLRDDGTLWLNLGDTYAGGSGRFGLPSGNLVGIPWRVALALQADGWVLRQDIVWQKPSPMPESVQNRCTKSHEYVFLLTKGMRYFCDMDAIKTPSEPAERVIGGKSGSYGQAIAAGIKPSGNGVPGSHDRTGDTSNKRSVWSIDDERALLDWIALNDPALLEKYLTESGNKIDVWRISSQGYPGAHFATFPPKLIEPMILAGTSAKGCCAECGAPWRRVIETVQLIRERPNEYVKRTGEEGTGNSCANTVAGVESKTLGWEPTCECNGKLVKKCIVVRGYGSYHNHEQDGVEYGLRQGGNGPVSNPGPPTKEFIKTVVEYLSDLPLNQHPVKPCSVLDLFIGSGTTAVVSLEHGRYCIGIDLSEEYLTNHCIPRLTRLQVNPQGESKQFRSVNSKVNTKLRNSLKLKKK